MLFFYTFFLIYFIKYLFKARHSAKDQRLNMKDAKGWFLLTPDSWTTHCHLGCWEKRGSEDCFPHQKQRAQSGSADKETVCSAGDLGSVSWLGRSPGKANSYPLQYSSDCVVLGVTKGHDWATFMFISPNWCEYLTFKPFLTQASWLIAYIMHHKFESLWIWKYTMLHLDGLYVTTSVVQFSSKWMCDFTGWVCVETLVWKWQSEREEQRQMRGGWEKETGSL